ncbi:SdrD B-like domain-containing protein [Actinokineospora enzanensis]|uniref:SdrD B-like domain-containing protein n=1 Tax=Actinokineospora enzanensis TaxID=155975 RepID=UPI000373DFE4|nr:SdrD B-like domain-containing protein [Actinokineospora enzanensis]
MSKSRAARRTLAAALAATAAAAGVVFVSSPVEASIERGLTLAYDSEVYGDFLQTGNGSLRCPDVTDPVDPFGEPRTTCATTQDRSNVSATGINDSYYMRWADVDSIDETYNSSTASLTIPTGAKVDFARLNWGGNTGKFRGDDGVMSEQTGCSSRQVLADAGSANKPTGSPSSTQVWFTTGGSTLTYLPAVVNSDSTANIPNSQPQYYTAYADVTGQVQGLASGSAQTIGVGNVWTPEGFGCYGGWSLEVVYYYDAPDATNAPVKRHVFVYDGHIRQSSSDSAVSQTINNFTAISNNVHAGVTAYEGDFNLNGDTFSINSTAQGEPLATGTTNNFFVGNAPGKLSPSVANNMSVDSKRWTTSAVLAGDLSATMGFTTTNDTFVLEGMAMSVPVASLTVAKTITSGGPFRPGDTVPYQIVVTSPGATASTVAVSDPLVSNCDKTIGALAADTPYTYTCSGPAPQNDFTNVANASGLGPYGEEISGQGKVDVDVFHPSIAITKTADKANYAAGETITFTITVHNDGDSPLTGVAVTDAKVAGCASTIGSLGTGGSNSYTCTATAPITGDSNTATVTGTDQLGGTVTDSDTASVPTVGAVSGKVFSDRENNGTFDAGSSDSGISGVAIALTGSTTIGSNPVNLNTTTASDGTFSFPNIQAGTYTLTETQPTDFDAGTGTPGTNATKVNDNSFTVTLLQGANSANNLFAEKPTSSFAGSVYIDANNDGIRQGAETGIQNTLVSLAGTDSQGNAISLTMSTDSNGLFMFPALRQGIYSLAENQPLGYSDGKDTAGTSGGSTTISDLISGISLAARTDATGYLFGEYVASSITGSVVDDAGNPIQGATVTLSMQGGGTTPGSTASNGQFVFPNLAPGTYTLTETQPLGYGDGPETAGLPAGNITVNDVISGIVIASNTAAVNYKFAETRGSIAGFVYVDKNNNGLMDPGEAPIQNASVTLTGMDVRGNPVNTPVTSGPTGSFLFSGLVASTNYTLTEVTPSGYTDGKETVGTASGTNNTADSISGINLTAGTNATGYLFGEYMPGSLAGRVVDDGGNGIKNVSLLLTGVGAPIPATTNSNGDFSFPNLVPGTYSLLEGQPTGYADGADEAGTLGGTLSGTDQIDGIVVNSGDEGSEYLFSEIRGSIKGVVYEDKNNNGVQDPNEPGIGNVPVVLTGTDANGDPVNVQVTSVAGTTEADAGTGDFSVTGGAVDPPGTFTFMDVVGGEYSLSENTPEGYLDGKETAGTAGGSSLPPDEIVGIALTGGQNATGYRFGELMGASISGMVTYTNVDGPNPIDNVLLTLTGKDDLNADVNEQIRTDSDGVFTFDGLRPSGVGGYTLTEESLLPQYLHLGQAAGSAGGITTLPHVISGIALDPAEKASEYEFTEKLGSLSGKVFQDFNDNGIQDPAVPAGPSTPAIPAEPGIPGVTVTLTYLGVATSNPPVTAVTKGDGSYNFPNLLGGEYTLTETQPANYADGLDKPGGSSSTPNGTLEPPDTITDIELSAGADLEGYTFAEKGGIINGTVWRDENSNGTIDIDETVRYPGVTITLKTAGGQDVTTATTNSQGVYSFKDIPGGSYVVVESQPVGLGSSTPDSVPVTLSVVPVARAAAEPNPTGAVVNFGDQLGLIGDLVWSDTNGNGLQDSGEPGVQGVTVILFNEAGTEVTRTTTNTDGVYWFRNIEVGNYTVGIEPPTGKVLTKPGVAGDDKNSDFNWVTMKTATIPIQVVAAMIPQLTTIDAGLVNKLTDLSVGVTTDTPSATIGATVVFSAKVTNAGTVPVKGARTTIKVPDGLKIVSAGGTAVAANDFGTESVDGDAFQAEAAAVWTCTISGQIATCTTDATILPGQSTSPVLVNTTALTTVADTTAIAGVTLADGTADDNSANDAAQAVVGVVAPTETTTTGTSTSGTLASTGANVRWLFYGGALLIVIGCATVFLVRRRKGNNTPE